MRSTKTRSLAGAACAALALLSGPAVAGNVKISGLPAGSAVSSTDVIPATQGTCPSSCATNGVSAAQLKTFTSTAPTFNTFAGLHAVTSITAGATAQIGTGGTVVCASSHVCDSISGELTITTGSGTLAAGTIFTVNFADTRTNIPDCVVDVFQTGSTSTNSHEKVETTTSLAVSTTLSASTTYTTDYVCAGN
jgi:hypothetical protein